MGISIDITGSPRQDKTDREMNRKRWSLHCITQLPRSIDYLDCAPRSFVNLLPIRQERRSNIESQLLPRKSVLFWWKSVGFVFVAGHYEIGALVLCGLQFWGRALNERWFQVWLPEEEATRFLWKEINRDRSLLNLSCVEDGPVFIATQSH